MEYSNSFENHLREQGKAEKSIQSYTGDVAGYLSFLSNKEIQFDGIINRFATLFITGVIYDSLRDNF